MKRIPFEVYVAILCIALALYLLFPAVRSLFP